MPRPYNRIIPCTFAFACLWYGSTSGQIPAHILTNPSPCNLHLTVKDNSCGPTNFFGIDVTNAPGTVLGTDVFLKEVRLIIAHDWPADLDVTLISPNDAAIDLASDNGVGTLMNYGNPFDCSQYTAFLSNNDEDACHVKSFSASQPPYIGAHLAEQSFIPVHDGTNPNGRWLLKVCDDATPDTGYLEFVELVFAPMGCFAPTGVSVVRADSNSVTLDWLPGLHCDSAVVEIGPVGFTPGTGLSAGSLNSFVFSGACPRAMFTGQGLTGNTTYQVYIREKCHAGFSPNSCPIVFETTCSPPTITLKEDFNSQTNCLNVCGTPCPITGVWQNDLTDNFDWIVQDRTNITTSGTGPSDDYPGDGKYIYMDSDLSLCRNGRKGHLTSNCLRVQASADSCDMSFDFLMYGTHVNALRLEYQVAGSQAWTLLDQIQGNQGPLWKSRFLDLDFLHGQTVRLRFTAVGGGGSRGDIALDNITFYGTTDLGPAPFVYYLDEDGDGYGGPVASFSSCSFLPNTPGYVLNNLDCEDLSPNVHPDMMETPCDGFDQNCNGDGDEFDFAPPSPLDTSICSGVSVPFRAVTHFGGALDWYSDPLGMELMHTGPQYLMANFPQNLTSDPITLTTYVRERVTPVCFSSALSAVTITVLPQANIGASDVIEVCEGEMFNLNNVDIIDSNGANGAITFHSGLPATPANEISPVVVPSLGGPFYIASTPLGGCTDVVEVVFDMLPTPKAVIIGQDSVCKETTQTLLALDSNNTGLPLTFQWNTGDSDPTIAVASHPMLDGSDLYSIVLSAPNGCSSRDSITVQTIANIHQVRRVSTDVTTCNGSNGSILLQPLDGQAPFTFVWGNGQSFTGDSLLLSNLSQGFYAFTITDDSDQKCPFVIPGMTVNGPSAVVTSIQVADVSCNGLSDGCISLSVNGNNPIITWLDGSHGTSLCGITAGSYTVSITDGACENMLNIEVKQPTKLIVSPDLVSPTCDGGSDGSIELNVFGGSPPYSYDWENGLKTRKINNLTAGNYPVTITDSRGCFQEIPALNVTAPPPISYEITALVQPSCHGFQDGRLGVKPGGGTPPFDVDWSTGAMGTTINNLLAGSYGLSITDAKGCVFSETISLPQPDPLAMVILDTLDPSCKGANDGAIQVLAQGGIAPLQYLWSPNANAAITPTVTGLPEGGYLVSITDANQCELVSPIIELIGPELLAVEAILSHPPCIGQNTGAISILNDAALYDFEWDFDFNGPIITDQAPGSYTVVMTELATNCKVDTTFHLTTGQSLSVQVNKTAPACHGQANGSIVLQADGLAPLSYTWADVADNTSTRTLLPAGNYLATVTDANGCIITTGDMLLENPPMIFVETLVHDQPLCHGDSTGAIEVLALGGTGNLTYTWNTGETTPLLTGLGQGIYQIAVQDGKNCTANRTYPISWNPPISLTEKRHVSGCVTLDSVEVLVNGGVPGYTYMWSNGHNSPSLVQAPIGDYNATVTDAVGCTEELMSVKIAQTAMPILFQEVPANDSICHYETIGEVAILVNGGSYPYQYIWNNGTQGSSNEPVLTLGNLTPNLYQVTITDSDGCTAVSPFLEVVQGSALVPQTNFTNVHCKSGTDGTISFSATGGFSPYSYLWQSPAGDTLPPQQVGFLENLSAGIYALQITDAQGCTQTTSVGITEPAENLGISSFSVTPVTCFGDTNGSINIQPEGGTLPYQYQWNNGATTEDNTQIGAGVHSLVITDANLCSYLTAFTVTGPDRPLALDSFQTIHPLCFDDANGSIDVDMGGGTPPYTYDWGMSNNEDLTNIRAGEYHLTVIDATMKCNYDTFFVLVEPPLLTADTASTPATSGQLNGSATVTPQGGTPPYQVFWETGDTSLTISGLAPDWYNFVITDANFCQTIGGVMVGAMTAIFDQEQLLGFNAYPNPTSGQVTLEFHLSAALEAEVQLLNAQGQLVLWKKENLSEQAALSLDLHGMPSGIYQVLVRSGQGLLAAHRVVKR